MNKSQRPEWFEDETTEASGEKVEKKSRLCSCSCGCVFLGFVELALCGFFVYSAIVQNNDIDGLQWIIYYSINAAIPALFLVHYLCCFPAKVIYALSFITAIWSTVYVVIASLDVKNTSAGGATEGTGDNDNQTLLTEYVFELGGASIGLLSSLYHPCMAKCCVKK